MDHNRVVVAVNVRIYAIHPLKDLAHEAREHLGEGNTCEVAYYISACSLQP